jgi:hypothetical protein
MRLAAAVVVLACPLVAGAHAFLDHADPKVGSTVDTPPKEIKAYFTEEVEPAFSTLRVLDDRGNEVDKKDTHLDPDDHKLLIVSLPELKPGTYKVEWKVVASDTHHTKGTFSFTFKPKS